jgi:hypothetical protein
MGKNYNQLSIEGRTMIQAQLQMGIKPAAIAVGLNRSASTLSRERSRNGWVRVPACCGPGCPRMAGTSLCAPKAEIGQRTQPFIYCVPFERAFYALAANRFQRNSCRRQWVPMFRVKSARTIFARDTSQLESSFRITKPSGGPDRNALTAAFNRDWIEFMVACPRKTSATQAMPSEKDIAGCILFAGYLL